MIFGFDDCKMIGDEWKSVCYSVVVWIGYWCLDYIFDVVEVVFFFCFLVSLGRGDWGIGFVGFEFNVIGVVVGSWSERVDLRFELSLVFMSLFEKSF